MKKEANTPHKFITISDLHRVLGLPSPLHPLVSLVNNWQVKVPKNELPPSLLLNFYKISFIANLNGKIKYGQSYYDFDEGSMVFTSPNQIMRAPDDSDEYEGFNLFIHPIFYGPIPWQLKSRNTVFFLMRPTKHCIFLTKKRQPSFQFLKLLRRS